MIRSRIAPTPSGYLHAGNAFNFVLTWLWVHREGGSLRLRIDDLDTPRTRPEYMDDIFRSLDWLGMDWDEGPQTPDQQRRICSQSLRTTRYDEVIAQLTASGKVFACDCSRSKLEGQNCHCREKNIPLSYPDITLRIETPAVPVQVPDMKAGLLPVNLQLEMKDFVIRRRDGVAAYQVASLTDDSDFDINLIIRGADLLPSTAAQLYLASLTGDKKFPATTFYHHALLKDEEGHKLSKSAGSQSLKTLREKDSSAEQFYIRLSGLMGYKEACTSLRAMLQQRGDF